MRPARIRLRAARVILLFYVAVLCVAGLNPRDFSHRNDVSWLRDGSGIRFDGHGLGYTERLGAGTPDTQTTSFTLLVDLRAVWWSGRRGFEHVLTFFDDGTDTQLLLGQWKNSLVVTNGEDYDYRQRRPRLSATLDADDERWHRVVVTVGPRGSRLFVDGLEVDAIEQPLTLPSERGTFRLLLGNSVHGNQGWRGMIRGVALLRGTLNPSEVEALTAAHPMRGLDRLELHDAVLLYAFAEGRGDRSEDLSGGAPDLSFPPERVMLAPDLFDLGFRDARLPDVVVNLLGFVPFGFLGALVLRGGTGWSRASVLAVVLGAGAALSTGMELAQAWMPMRSSSVLDLLLNAAGTLAGATGYLLLDDRVKGLLRSDAQPES